MREKTRQARLYYPAFMAMMPDFHELDLLGPLLLGARLKAEGQSDT